MNRLLPWSAGLAAAVGSVILTQTACDRNGAKAQSLVVFNAGALARPIRAALDSFSSGNGAAPAQESAGSLETARKITELGRVPDVVALADTAIFSGLLRGRLDGPVTVLGTTRMVLAYTARSRFAGEVNSGNWHVVTTRSGVQVGRSDPAMDPAGYRALLVMQLAEQFYASPGLAARLARSAPPANVRPKSADLVALLQTGNLDYAWEYESVARSLGLRFIVLPPEIDLGDLRRAASYSAASVEVPAPGPLAGGRNGRASTVVRGAPIVFGAAVPARAANRALGRRFIAYLVSPAGRAILAAGGLHPVGSVSGAETR